MKNNKKQYLVPELTVVSFHVEHGFNYSTSSSNKFHMFFQDMITEDGNTYNNQGQQVWNDENSNSNIFGETWQ